MHGQVSPHWGCQVWTKDKETTARARTCKTHLSPLTDVTDMEDNTPRRFCKFWLLLQNPGKTLDDILTISVDRLCWMNNKGFYLKNKHLGDGTVVQHACSAGIWFEVLVWAAPLTIQLPANALGESHRGRLKCLGSCIHMEDVEEAPGFGIWTGSAPAVVALWE